MKELSIYSSDLHSKRYFPEYYVALRKEIETEYDEITKSPKIIDEYLLGFATPFEDNKAFEKRKSTADSWANERQWDPITRKQIAQNYSPIRIDNTPELNFKINNIIRRSYRTNNVLWRVKDPRGFELEITSENLCMIIQEVGINKDGIIPARCVWLRIGPQNHLIPEGCKTWNRWISHLGI